MAVIPQCEPMKTDDPEKGWRKREHCLKIGHNKDKCWKFNKVPFADEEEEATLTKFMLKSLKLHWNSGNSSQASDTSNKGYQLKNFNLEDWCHHLSLPIMPQELLFIHLPTQI